MFFTGSVMSGGRVMQWSLMVGCPLAPGLLVLGGFALSANG